MVDVVLAVIAIIVIVIGVLGALILYARCYVRVPPNKVLVVFGRQQPGVKFSYGFVLHGGRFIMPIFEDHGFMPLETFTDHLELNDIVTNDRNHLRISVLADYNLCKDNEGLQAAAQNFFGKGNETLKAAVEVKISVATVDVIAENELAQVVPHRAQIAKEIRAKAAETLLPMGLALTSISIKDLQEHGVVVSDIHTMKGHLKDLRSELAELEGKLSAIEKEKKN
jgi:flotillin